jgi:hypothetical protein
MKVIIAGSRNFYNLDDMLGYMSTLPPDFPNEDGEITEVVSGGARGADLLGEAFAKMQNIPVKRFVPDWDGLGKRAGMARNAEMGMYADALIAFWDGESKGTQHMINYMQSLEKPVYVFKTK